MLCKKIQTLCIQRSLYRTNLCHIYQGSVCLDYECNRNGTLLVCEARYSYLLNVCESISIRTSLMFLSEHFTQKNCGYLFYAIISYKDHTHYIMLVMCTLDSLSLILISTETVSGEPNLSVTQINPSCANNMDLCRTNALCFLSVKLIR